METEKQVTQVSVEDLTNILKGHQFLELDISQKNTTTILRELE